MVETTHLSESAREDGWNALRRQFDIKAFGVNAWTAKEADAALISEHDEARSGHEELYVLVSGKATVTVDGESLEAVPGTAVFVRDPESKRSVTALVPGTTVLAIGGKPGQAYVPRAWETNALIFPLFGQGDFEEARRQLAEAVDRYEDREALLYNLACAEARLGETEAALGHLAEAVRRSDRLIELARTDEDLDSLRGESRFDELIGATTTG
jgi:tetratricopeptide (TPR) repeat protein